MPPEDAAAPTLNARCCIAGGGPAGMMLGLLLARAGVDVVVLEKHADFFRDFRGDTIHPSTLQLMHELGLLDEFLKRPHNEVRELSGQVGDTTLKVVDFTHVPTVCKYLVLMPQWEFLDFLAQTARRYATFRLLMEAAVTDLIFAGDRVAGVRVMTPSGPLEVRSDLVVGADGRSSDVRRTAGLSVEVLGAPMDVLWFELSRLPSDPEQTFGRIDFGKLMVMLNRGTYWQCGYIIRKGGIDAIRARGLDAFRADIVALAPHLRDRVGELRVSDDVKLLTVAVDRLRRWYRPGLLCIGDAAHAMSPIGGVGINLAIQDAVATANFLASDLRRGKVSTARLRAVQTRRMFPTRVTQAFQVFIQSRVIDRILGAQERPSPPWILRFLLQFRPVRWIPALLVGVGVRPEHVRTKPTP